MGAQMDQQLRSIIKKNYTEPGRAMAVLQTLLLDGYFSRCLKVFFTTQTLFVSLKEALNQTLCSLPTSDMLDIASDSMLQTSCTISSTSVADTRK